ncbi:hypothetical protein Ddc_18395 [Ditylenchus destructor]|nr:hypothetical protein Ddc_18395 [Ditylenchus destructor]
MSQNRRNARNDTKTPVTSRIQSAFGRQCLVLGHTGVEYSILWLCQCQLAAFGRSNGGFVSANSRPSAARTVALSVPTRGLRPRVGTDKASPSWQ